MTCKQKFTTEDKEYKCTQSMTMRTKYMNDGKVYTWSKSDTWRQGIYSTNRESLFPLLHVYSKNRDTFSPILNV